MNTPSRHENNASRGGVITRLLIVLAVVCILGVVAWVLLLPSVVAKVVSSRTGFAFKAEQVSVNPLAGTVRLDGLKLENPSTYPKPDFVDLRHFSADVDVGSLFSDKLVIESATVDLESLTLIRAIDGTLNAKLFADRLQGEDASQSAPERKGEKAPAKAYLIKHLEVRVGKLRTESYSGQKPAAREFNLGFAQTYQNVTDVKQLLSGPIMKSFSAAGAALTNLMPSDWAKLLEDGGKSGKTLLKELGRRATEALQSTSGTLEESRKP
ncbi:MAG: AsmA family protein [Opitutaceae bacterium]|nr:AsmA family protein [Opitutaceae bacterium]